MRSVLIMMILAALSAAAAMYVTRNEVSLSASAGASRIVPGVESIPADEVTSITLHRHGESPLRFVRETGGWVQTEPIRHPVDQFSIVQLVELARALTIVEQIDIADLGRGLTVSALGLDPPRCVIKYEWAGDSLALELGRRGFGGRGYVRVRGRSGIFVVAQDLHERAIVHDPRDWRDRTVFPGIGPDVESIEMISSDRTTVLNRDKSSWQLSMPVQTRAEAEAIEQLLSAMARARQSGFVMDDPDDLSRFGLDPPAGSFSFSVLDASAEQPRSSRLLIGSRIGLNSEDRFAMVEGRATVFRISAAVLAALFPPLDKLIAATASGVNPADIKTIFISIPDHEFRLQRDLERWVAPDHGDAPVPARQVEELLNLLTNVRAPRVVVAEFPQDKPSGFITLHGFDSRPRDTVRIARDPQTGQWAMENGDGVIRVFSESVRVPLSPQDFGLRVVSPES